MNGVLTVPCPHCKAGRGTPCTIPGTQWPLKLSPAHPSRMEAAGLRPDYSVVGKYREMYPASAREAAAAVKPTEGGQPPKEDHHVAESDSQPPVTHEQQESG